jgi:hypothetical protein
MCLEENNEMSDRVNQSDNSIILIESLTLINYLYILIFKRNNVIYYVFPGKFLGRFYGFFESLNQLTKIRIKKLIYVEFPESLIDTCEQAHFHVNDQLFEKFSDNIYLKMGMDFLRNPKYTFALKHELFNRYTLKRMKTFVFLKNLTIRHSNVVFFPVDNEPIFNYVSKDFKTKNYSIPGFVLYINKIKTFFNNLTGVFLLIAVTMYIFSKCVLRGIIIKKPLRQSFRYGLDLQKIGLKKDRGLDNDGNFFLYDDQDFKPGAILHVIRDHLEDDEARQSLLNYDAPYTEFDKLKIPLPFLVRELIFGLFIVIPALVLKNILCMNYRAIPIIPVMATIKMKIEAEILYHYFDIKVFISRDEYSPYHVIRTIVANSKGNHTIGFQWADYFIRGVPLNHVFFDKYLIYSDFYKKFHEKSLQYCPTDVIGCGIYWSDRIFQLLEKRPRESNYANLKEKYYLVGIFGSSFGDETDISREQTLKFYADCISVLKKYDSVYTIIKPKADTLNLEINDMIKDNDRACVEMEMWTPRFLCEPDLIICIGDSTIGIESLFIGKRMIFYNVIQNTRDLYSKYSPLLVADSYEKLDAIIKEIVVNNNYVEKEILEKIVETHGYHFDGKVLKRFKQHCNDLILKDKKIIC